MTLKSHLSSFPSFNLTVQHGVSKGEHLDRVYYNGELCYQHDNSTPLSRTVYVKCSNDLVGNQLRLQLANISTQLILCDFRVYGECKDRTWGESCENTCGTCINLSQCNKTNGHCQLGCEVGYKNTSDCKTAVEQEETVFMLQITSGGLVGAIVAVFLLMTASILVTACICRRKYLPTLRNVDEKSYANNAVSVADVQASLEQDESGKSAYQSLQTSTKADHVYAKIN